MDALNVNDHAEARNVGRQTVLPSSFTGGPRHMQQAYHDAMSIVRRFGKPDLFITFTCNPNWPEITSELLVHQTAQDRPDLVARVFKLKRDALLEDLKKVFGDMEALSCTTEFQKRGLPHEHILIILKAQFKPRNTDDYDKFVSSELPDPVTQPLLFAAVQKHMVHGPCSALNQNARCMKDGVCTKNYPKSYVNTIFIFNNY